MRLVLRHRLTLGLVLAGLAALLLFVAEWDRRRRLAAHAAEEASTESLDLASAEALRQQYADPAEFERLCADLRDQVIAIQERCLGLRHTRTSRFMRFDKDGRTIAATTLVERAWFEGEVARKEEVERHYEIGTLKPETPPSAGSAAIYPFSKKAVPGTYRYTFDGVEEIDGRLAMRLRCDPCEPLARKFRGLVWADASTREPRRAHYSPAQLPALTDRADLIFEYGPTETAGTQIRRTIVDGCGGFAFVFQHYRVETDLSDFHVLGP
jgi:hypothetical protein